MDRNDLETISGVREDDGGGHIDDRVSHGKPN